jgi:N-acyl-D-aspartate/D-glutamate deacylase
MYDLVIRTTRIADGLGALVDGDPAVKHGRVAMIGRQ